MRTKRPAIVLLAALFLFAASATNAQSKVALKIKAEQGKIVLYKLKAGGTVNLDLKQLPFPGATVKADNINAAAGLALYFDTISVEDGAATYDFKVNMDSITLGKLLQLTGLTPPGAAAVSGQMVVSPSGKIQDVKIDKMDQLSKMAPGGGGGFLQGLGMDLGSMGPEMILPMAVGIMPAILPDGEIAVGDTWQQKLQTEEAPIPFLPEVTFDFKLESVEGDMATISFTTVGTFDASFLKGFLSMIPEIPMGENIMSIKDIGLIVPWDVKGTMLFNVREGRFENVKADMKTTVTGNAKIKFTLPDGSKENWDPDLKVDVLADVTMEYGGAVDREEYMALFPPPEEEPAEEGAGEGSL